MRVIGNQERGSRPQGVTGMKISEGRRHETAKAKRGRTTPVADRMATYRLMSLAATQRKRSEAMTTKTTKTKPKNGRTGKRAADSRRAYKGVCVRKDLRLAIYLRDRFACLYCLRDLHDADPRDITLDHVTPDHDGGGNEAGNLICACRHCNSARQDTPLARYCGPETRQHVRRNTRRSIKRYRKLAKAILNGETEDPRGN